MRIEAGAVVEELSLDGVGTVSVGYARADAGWTAEFVVRVAGIDDLAVVHRLTAPTLGAARRAVPEAAAFLAGEPLAPGTPLG